jgi:hypothetical protein
LSINDYLGTSADSACPTRKEEIHASCDGCIIIIKIDNQEGTYFIYISDFALFTQTALEKGMH